MPEFNAKCDFCKVTFRASVYGFRARRVARCPRCGRVVKSYRKRPKDYVRLVFHGMQGAKAIWKEATE
jgi:uncharacterized paraquat-inducible protein A